MMSDINNKNSAPENLSLKELLEKRDKEKGISRQVEEPKQDFYEYLKSGLERSHTKIEDGQKTQSAVFSELKLRDELENKFNVSKSEITSEMRGLSELLAESRSAHSVSHGVENRQCEEDVSNKQSAIRKMLEDTMKNRTSDDGSKARESVVQRSEVADSVSKSINSNKDKTNKKAKNEKISKQSKQSPTETPAESPKERNDRILSSLKASDIKLAGSPGKKSRLPELARRFVMAVLLVVMICAVLYLGFSIYSRTAADRYYSELREKFYSETDDVISDISMLVMDSGSSPELLLFSAEGNTFEAPAANDDDLYTKYQKMLPNLEALKSINSAAFAWIRVEGTRVDYPVVQSPQGNNDYYLDHGLERSYSVSGAVFTDYANSRDLSKNRNTCVYGHNMNDGTMFQTIMNFKTLNQFKNGTIEMYTKEGIYIYKPFAVYEALPTESFFKVNFESDSEFASFLEECTAKSMFNAGLSLSPTDKVITLITCTNTIVDKRFVVQGVLTDIIK